MSTAIDLSQIAWSLNASLTTLLAILLVHLADKSRRQSGLVASRVRS